MKDINEYVIQHPDAVKIGTVPFQIIIQRLKTIYHAQDIPVTQIPSLRMHRFNAFHLPSNESLRLTEDQLQVKAIKIDIDQGSEHYTVKDFVPICAPDPAENYVYLAYEEQVGYHYSNSNLLFLEVALERGISADDMANRTEDYMSYLFYLKCYLQHTNPGFIED